MIQTIRFHSADKTFTFKGKNRLKDFIVSIFKKEKKAVAGMDYIFCSDEYLLQINKDFLQHDYYTDIITFGLSPKGEPIEGEVYISLDRVKDNSKTLNTPYQEEILRVIFHGVLHLCGYKDKKKADIELMREKESHYIKLYKKTIQ
ncbi:rRNA maturation RNase YbeY [Chitinophagaceae bacterium LWZ2-11]